MVLFVWNRLAWVGKDITEILKSYKNELRLQFYCYILIPRKCPRKTLFQHTVPLPVRILRKNVFSTENNQKLTVSNLPSPPYKCLRNT